MTFLYDKTVNQYRVRADFDSVFMGQKNPRQRVLEVRVTDTSSRQEETFQFHPESGCLLRGFLGNQPYYREKTMGPGFQRAFGLLAASQFFYSASLRDEKDPLRRVATAIKREGRNMNLNPSNVPLRSLEGLVDIPPPFVGYLPSPLEELKRREGREYARAALGLR